MNRNVKCVHQDIKGTKLGSLVFNVKQVNIKRLQERQTVKVVQLVNIKMRQGKTIVKRVWRIKIVR